MIRKIPADESEFASLQEERSNDTEWLSDIEQKFEWTLGHHRDIARFREQL